MSPNASSEPPAPHDDPLVYAIQTPSPALYLTLGSLDTLPDGTVLAIPEHIPRPPSFPSLVEEREDRKRQLAGGFRVFGKMGWGFGVNGHVTVKDPIRTDCFWINPWVGFELPRRGFSRVVGADWRLSDVG